MARSEIGVRQPAQSTSNWYQSDFMFEPWQLPITQVRAAHALFGEDVMDALGIEASLAMRNVDGGTGPEAVARQVKLARERL